MSVFIYCKKNIYIFFYIVKNIFLSFLIDKTAVRQHNVYALNVQLYTNCIDNYYEPYTNKQVYKNTQSKNKKS